MDKALEELLKQLSRKELPYAFSEQELLQRIRAEAELRTKRHKKRKWSVRILTAAAASLTAGIIGLKSYSISHTQTESPSNPIMSQTAVQYSAASSNKSVANSSMVNKQIPADEQAAVDGYFTGLMHKDQSELYRWVSSAQQKSKSVMTDGPLITIGYSVQPSETNSNSVIVNRSLYEPNPNGAFSQVVQTQITYAAENGKTVISGFHNQNLWTYRVEDSGSLVELVNTGGADRRKVLQTAEEIGSGTIQQIAIDPRNPEQFAYLKKLPNGNEQIIMRVASKDSLVTADVPAGAQQLVWSSDSLHVGIWIPDSAQSSASLLVLNPQTGAKDVRKFSFADQNTMKKAWIDAIANGLIEVYQPESKSSQRFDPNSHSLIPAAGAAQ